MKQKCTTWATLAASIFVGGAIATNSQGQNSDALLNTLIKKGVISEQEAKDIKAEASKDTQAPFNQAFAAKTGMPSWITSYKLYGDFRGRFEENYAENAAYNARERYRIRLRMGLNVNMLDNFDVGLRLASGNPIKNSSAGANNSNPGGQPITANQDLGSLESRKWLWIDAAYGRWTPIKNDTWTVSGTIGKMDNPFQLSNMVWDYDIDPEGAALQLSYNLTSQHTLKGTGAAFILDEINQNTTVGAAPNPINTVHAGHDPYVYGGQLLLESKWAPAIESSFGVAAFNIVHRDSLSAKFQPFYNAGNSRNINGFLLNDFNPIIGSGSVTYKIPTSQTTTFPIKIAGEYMKNPAAHSQNKAYRFGGTLGKAGRKNTWEINYRYQWLEADAWYDALVDDDNGVFYAGPVAPATLVAGQPLFGTPSGGGWFGGTNLRGHQVVATYSFTDFLNLSVIYYLNKAIINQNAAGATDTRSTAGHFMIDLMWKF